MSNWNAMAYAGKDTILAVVRKEAEQFFEMVDSDDAWAAPTGAGHWQVRDVVGHLVDTTEAYFVAFDTARAHGEAPPAYGLPGMTARVNEQAMALRSEPRAALVERLRGDFDKMMEILDALTEEGPCEFGVSDHVRPEHKRHPRDGRARRHVVPRGRARRPRHRPRVRPRQLRAHRVRPQQRRNDPRRPAIADQYLNLFFCI